MAFVAVEKVEALEDDEKVVLVRKMGEDKEVVEEAKERKEKEREE